MPPKRRTQSDGRGQSRNSRSALSWIQAKAKQIRRANPRKEWKQCISEASALYRRER